MHINDGICDLPQVYIRFRDGKILPVSGPKRPRHNKQCVH